MAVWASAITSAFQPVGRHAPFFKDISRGLLLLTFLQLGLNLMATLSFKGASHLSKVTQEKGVELSGDPVVRALLFHCWGPRSFPGWGSRSCNQKKKKKRLKMREHPVISARITSPAFSYQLIISHSTYCSLSPLDHELHEEKFFLYLYLLKTYCSNSWLTIICKF